MSRLLALFSVFVLAGCASLLVDVEPPRVSVAEVSLKSLGLLEQKFDLGLRVANPNRFDFRIEALDFEVELNGKPFAKGLTRVSTLVAATSSSVVRVDALTQSRDLVDQARLLSPSALKRGVPYRIVGRVKIDKRSQWLPFDYRGVYGGERTPAERRT